MRARRECIVALGEAKCGGMASAALVNSTRFALKLGEHTWGFNWGYLDSQSYTNSDLAHALANAGGFAKTQDGWVEQRSYVDHTLTALQIGAATGDEGCAWLLERTQAELAKLRPTAEPIQVAPSTPAQGKIGTENDGKWVEIDPSSFSAEVTDLPQWGSLVWNYTAGGISKLVHKHTGHNYARASGTGSLAQYQYQTLTEGDFWIFMNATLKVQREVAFGKFNLTANAPNLVSGSWTGKLKRMFRNRETSNSNDSMVADRFLHLVEMPAALHADAGAPRHVWTQYDFMRSAAMVNITLSWFDKTRTRLPEAHWMDFELALPSRPRRTTAVPDEDDCDSWLVPKLNSTFCATDVSLFGATHVHAVSDARPLRWQAADGNAIGLRTIDAAIVALEYKSALPEHVNTTVDEHGASSQAAYINLCNNFWTTK
eukprot:COSAG02_NODE_601_length_19715_cov_445.701315_13_plen_429_part_00